MNESFWLARARREALRFNFGWWLQCFLPWVVGAGVAGAVAVVAARSAHLDPAVVLHVLWGVLGVGAVWAWIAARGRFLSRSESLVRLDADLRLCNRLTAAADGVGDWPPSQPSAALALRWNARPLVWPPLAAAALICAALWMPMPAGGVARTVPAAMPPAWAAMDEKLDALREEKLVRAEAISEFAAALDALKSQPAGDWFRHESLEAGDHLSTQLDQQLAGLQKSLEAALGALEAARQIEAAQVGALGTQIDQALGEALQGLEAGALPLDEKFLSQLKGLDLSAIRQLSAEQWQAMRAKLSAGIGTCSGGLNHGEGAGAAFLAQAGLGMGGVSRGPGSAPLTLGDLETRLGSTATEGVSNDNLTNAVLGDAQGLSAKEHTVDRETYSGPQAGGTMAESGTGGDAALGQSASPDERAALQRFFQ